ncbi:DNA gyrase subunit A [Blastopirellula sp. JC732]|uniref:DNA topoisomerase (ATP-hydrolyzing) n=1 Tax=Blastopirellula sediminis TaxID=2894196 RepID=A0A9X1SHM1_9BACT|nr:DNA gyrase subunit A [Blastopirellula sediminis]MCC9606707.1 DNA gyrase subunit A [Blastopirellula sediminis]MCC9629996.1 DNA gyrase subunit A [Blastopirellula sediminis]
MSIEDELKESYLTYAMSVIVSRALPDVRDGLKPSQRRILVAMNDLNLTPGSQRVKCAKISGDTSGNYHPHGESVIYPTLVRMAQEWNTRYLLVDKQGNFGSIAGLPPAAMRYTEARMSGYAQMLLEDLRLDTVDYIPTYDERNTEPTVLPSKFPNLLVNGSQGIAVGMATSIPPHNLGEVCRAVVRVIEEPTVPIEELLRIIPGPDFPTGGIICGRSGVRRGYLTGRSTILVRSRTTMDNVKGRNRIIIHDIPYQQTRDRVEERIAAAANEGKIVGISGVRNESDLKEPVRLVIELKRDADPDVVLNQLFQFTPIQDTFSIIMLALVDGKPRTLSIRDLIDEFIRHRVNVIRRRTQFLLSKARQRKHTVEGLLLALADIDEIIRIIRSSSTQAEAKTRLMGIESPASMLARALGDEGFALFQQERGVADVYTLTGVQADAILRMTLGQLVNLEQERLSGEHAQLLEEIREYLRILSDEGNIREIIRDQMLEIEAKYGDKRRTEISHEELGIIDLEDLIEEETMVVSISHSGYIKRTPVTTYKAQRRGGKGIKGAKSEDEDPIQHLFVASTHAYLLFFTTKGKVYWQKVYDLPQLSRESRGRAIVNLLQLEEGERIADCRAIRDFDVEDHYLVMATRKGLVKKTPLEAYSRPMKKGIIAIKLREDDELVDVAVAQAGDELVLSTAKGMAIRFCESDARPMGRNSSGVKGINLAADDELVGMVVADPDAQLLTVCEHGYGKRTYFGPNQAPSDQEPVGDDDAPAEEDSASEEDELSSSAKYRTQRRGGKGLRDIKATARNGRVVSIVRVDDDDEVLMMTARGKIQRISAAEISIVGRNTQGVRIMSLDKDDSLAAVVRVPKDDSVDEEPAEEGAPKPPTAETTPPPADVEPEATPDSETPETDEE